MVGGFASAFDDLGQPEENLKRPPIPKGAPIHTRVKNKAYNERS